MPEVWGLGSPWIGLPLLLFVPLPLLVSRWQDSRITAASPPHSSSSVCQSPRWFCGTSGTNLESACAQYLVVSTVSPQVPIQIQIHIQTANTKRRSKAKDYRHPADKLSILTINEPLCRFRSQIRPCCCSRSPPLCTCRCSWASQQQNHRQILLRLLDSFAGACTSGDASSASCNWTSTHLLVLAVTSSNSLSLALLCSPALRTALLFSIDPPFSAKTEIIKFFFFLFIDL